MKMISRKLDCLQFQKVILYAGNMTVEYLRQNGKEI